MGYLRHRLGLIGAGVLLTFCSLAHAREMSFRVVDVENGQPLPDVKIRSWIQAPFRTDANGTFILPLVAPRQNDFAFRITITKEGYVERTISWSTLQKDKIEDMPTNYTAKMEPAIVIGGIVKNEKGEAIADVKIIFSAPAVDPPDARERSVLMPNFHTERTDENGRWLCHHVPKRFQRITYRLIHPDYMGATYGCNSTDQEVRSLPEKDFIETNAVMVLGNGLELIGTVTDASGRPPKEFTVTQTEEWRNPRAVVTTETNGQFKIINLRPGEMFLLVEAPGSAPQAVSVVATNPMPSVKVQLSAGKVLRGKVTDESGQPIAGAAIQLERMDFKALAYHWTATTTADGSFAWESAPAAAQAYFIAAENYQPLTVSSLVADGVEKVLVLRKHTDGMSTLFDGKVIDSISGKPLEKFAVQLRDLNSTSNALVRREFTNTGGVYAMPTAPELRGVVVEIRAVGHLPMASIKVSAGDGDQRLDFALMPGTGFEGHVLLPDGKPAVDAEVVLGTEEQGAMLGRRHFEDKEYSIVTLTDAEGAFSFAREAGAHTIFVVHEQGFAELDLDYAKVPFEIHLQPWGKIEGTIPSGGKSMDGQSMVLSEAFPVPFQRGLEFAPDIFTASIDARGKFTMADVPPIEVKLSRASKGKFSAAQFLVVKSDGVTQAGAGEKVGSVTGKLTLAGKTDVAWTNSLVRLMAYTTRPPAPETKDREAQKRWAILYWKSAEGKAWQRAQQTFNPAVAPDGKFSIDAVPPGKYQLQAQLREADGQRLASLSEEVTVEHASLDLGPLEMEAAKVMKTGTMAPNFDVTTTAGAPLRLADFRGKYVLLDFWATWCGPCVAEMPHMKATYDAFGKDERFVMIGLSLDAKVSAPKEFAQKNGIKWIQGFLGDWSTATVPADYGVEGIPAIFLIGPDGNIIARDLRGEGIQSAVENALRKK